MLTHHPDIMRHSPTRPTDWRWRRATTLADRSGSLDPALDDAATRLAAGYQVMLRRNPRRAAAKFSAVHAARELHDGPKEIRYELEARILARCTSPEITRDMRIDAPVVDAFETTFFSCRDRLDARDWVVLAAIGRLDEPDMGTAIKRFAYFGGPIVLEAMLASLRRREHGTNADALDPALLALDALTVPDSEMTFSRLSRLMVELKSQPLIVCEKMDTDAREMRPSALSPSDLRGEMYALQAATHAPSGPAPDVEPPERLISRRASAV
jgi:hypothetical protein